MVARPEELKRSRRRVDLLVMHCSATPTGLRYLPPQLVEDHKRRGFCTAGYHYYVTLEGDLFALRDMDIQELTLRATTATLSGYAMRAA